MTPIHLGRSEVKDKWGLYLHKFRCECGKEFIARYRSVKVGLTRSCGCYAKSDANKNKISKALIKKPEIERAVDAVFKQYRSVAKHKQRSFELTRDEVKILITARCRYCGRQPHRKVKNSNGRTIQAYVGGIDRKDSNIGYILSNCIACCATCNQMKMDLSIKEFITHILRILRHWMRGK